MTSGATTNQPQHGTQIATDRDTLTHVELTWIAQKCENWIRFGAHVGDLIIDRRKRIVSFKPNMIFAFVRWQSNDYGTIWSSIDIIRAVERKQPYSTLPDVQPGGEILLHISGWPKVIKVLGVIDAVEAMGIDASDVAPDHWRHVHNRLTVGEAPRPYTLERHIAWQKRMGVMS